MIDCETTPAYAIGKIFWNRIEMPTKRATGMVKGKTIGLQLPPQKTTGKVAPPT